jgi:hypothetical protein
MTNRVIVVSKTHLDLGFTDYAANIKAKYLEKFIPEALQLAKAANADGTKRFVWTTGSWIITEALKTADSVYRKELEDALKRGDLVCHALPFTTHTELMDEDLARYGLSLIDKIDAITGRKTIAAKMTDVPGHTAALVPLLAEKGIRLLHIGVNGASALPKVPECFLWRYDGAEIVVIYSGEYGGAFRPADIGDILYFDHTADNHGANNLVAINNKLNELRKAYPGYIVEAGSLNEIAEKLWDKRASLPIIENEIGDSWIHGVASDPYKTGCLRQLLRLKNEWLAEGSIKRGDTEYNGLCAGLLCVAEHTWGMDMKTYLGDYNHYTRKAFDKARKADKVHVTKLLRGFPQNLYILMGRLRGVYKKGSYRTMEASWAEQRGYVSQALSALSHAHREQAENCLKELLPPSFQEPKYTNSGFGGVYSAGGYTLGLNPLGGISKLSYMGVSLIRFNDRPPLEYRVYGKKDYDYFFASYIRHTPGSEKWSPGDFGRPLLKYADKHFRQGNIPYKPVCGGAETGKDFVKLGVRLTIDPYFYDNAGAPKEIFLLYTLTAKGLEVSVSWIDKPASRLSEGLFFRVFPDTEDKSVFYKKLGRLVSPYSVAENGNRNLSCAEEVVYRADFAQTVIENIHAPLVGLGEGKILRFDNIFESVAEDGLAFVLYNNVWGTNFPLWYGEPAKFLFRFSVRE